MRELLISLALVVFAVAGCQSVGGGGPGGTRDELRTESSSDPGLTDRGGSQRGVEDAGLVFESIFFDFDDDALGNSSKNTLRRSAQLLGDHGDARLEIQGNCDQRGTVEYNLALGKRRAEAARSYLINLGVDGSRLMTISFGEENPAVRGHNESAWVKNRRDDFVLR